MKTKTFIIGFALALALFLFAQRQATPAQGRAFNTIVDLTRQQAASSGGAQLRLAALSDLASAHRIPTSTFVGAPAQLARGLWTVDQIPAERLRAPLVVLDVTQKVRQDAGYHVSLDDIADWEKMNGQIPQGAVVAARTGWDSHRDSLPDSRAPDKRARDRFPGYSAEAARFLVDGRNIIGLGIDTPGIAGSGSAGHNPARDYSLAHSVYHLENLDNLGQVPASGATVVVAPMKLESSLRSPVRVLAMMK